MSGIIITAPHAYCFETRKYKHSCDYASGSSAEVIFNNLKTNNKFLNINTIPRYDGDMNRKESRRTNYRKIIRDEFKNTNYLFDIHSFPRMMDQKQFMNDVYIIDDDYPPTELSSDMNKYLQRLGYQCNLYRGSGVNDITNEAKENGLQAILIEICEDLSNKDIFELCLEISYFINIRLI
jgi:hypothetical protein